MQLEDFGLSGGTRKTLVILGAGASRGCSLVEDGVNPLPPLDLDFFQQVSRLPDSEAAEKLLAFVRAEYGHELRLSMEQFFSEADYTNRFHTELNVDRGARIKKFQDALENFHSAVADLLRLLANGDCQWHQRIIDRLGVGDSIISFNYDCIVDRALKTNGGNRWDPERGGYGFEISGDIDAWRTATRGQPPKSSIQLLKMHGSINWNSSKKKVRLVSDLSAVQSTKGSIIPPTWFKELTEEPYASIWKIARLAVRSARILIVVGYSVPQTDLFSQSLLKVEAGSKNRKEKLDALVLVNPDRAARRKFADLVSRGLEPATRILEYNSLEQLYERLTAQNQKGQDTVKSAG